MGTRTRRGVLVMALCLAMLLVLGLDAPVADTSRSDLSLTPRAALAPTPGDQLYPAVASNGSEFLVAWEDRRNGSIDATDIYASRVAADGTTLDPDGIPIATAAVWSGHRRSPPTARTSSWSGPIAHRKSRRRSCGAGHSGRRSPRPRGFVLTEPEQYGGYRPHAAFDGENYLVTYENCYCIRGIRVATDGTILDPGGFTISNTFGNLRNGVSYGEGEYLVTWHRNAGVFGARVRPDGWVLDPNGIAISTNDPDGYSFPVSTFDGTNFIVAWEDRRDDGDTSRVYAARVTPDEPSSIQGASRSPRRRHTWPAMRASPPVATAPSSPPGLST